MAQSADDLPPFPALSRVLLVEARHGVRTEIVKSLDAAQLFKAIVHPDSLSDALKRLGSERFDACIVGSSVKKAADFLKSASDKSRAVDCAFIAMVKAGSEQLVVLEADQVLSWPCNKRELTEGIVIGALNANSLSEWANKVLTLAPELAAAIRPTTVRRKKGTDRADPVSSSGSLIETALTDTPLIQVPVIESLSGIVPVGANGSLNPVSAEPSHPEPKPERMQPEAIASLLPSDLTDLSLIVEAIQRGDIGLDASGNPDRIARTALNQVVQKIFASAENTAKVNQFKEFFVYCLDRWFGETVNRGEEQAIKNLLERLKSYQDKYSKS
ncbi:MAG: hypothetical protein U0136_10520 [Bdellovibrionota bacterium]